jgi:hypothetical protein
MAKPAFAITLGQNNTPLINTEIAPLVIENKDIFINIDFSANAQNILTYPAFPIIVYRAFSWISRYDGVLNSYFISEPFSQKQGLLTSPSGNEYDASNTAFRFTEPGIWTYNDIAGIRSFIAVNMQDYENQSRHNPMTIETIEKDKILGYDDKGNEVWKVLLWGALVFLMLEMLLVLFLQKKAKV